MSEPSTQYVHALAPKIQRFIEHYLDTRDAALAGKLANIAPSDVDGVFNRREVKAEIERKIEIEDKAFAEIRAKARVLSVDKLDTKLLDILDLNSDATTSARVKALEIGYKRFGALIEKRENTGAGGEPMAFEIVRIGKKK